MYEYLTKYMYVSSNFSEDVLTVFHMYNRIANFAWLPKNGYKSEKRELNELRNISFTEWS